MRPQKLRLIAAKPACRRFSPDTGNDAPAMTLGLDMLEALRLADAEGLSQEEAARQMEISPPTFCRLLAEARRRVAQALTRVDGLRIDDVEPLLQLRQTGTPIGLRGLLVGGIVISALGAVMDVTMGIASSLAEVHAANPQLSRRELFRSGMNIGRDMVGTMTNTLILAFLGSGFTLILYLYSLGLPFRQLMCSAYVSMEVVSGAASSVGVILSIPLTALITAAVFTREKK